MSQQQTQDPATGPPLPPPVSLHDLMNIPAPVTKLLVDLAPFLASARRAAEVLNWSSSRTADSWLVLAAWWALCLVTDFSVRYFLPFALLATVPQLRRERVQTTSERGPATEHTLCETLEHVSRIQSLLPHPPSLPTLSLPVVARVIAISWIPTVVILHTVRVRVLLAIAGTIVITWRAPFAGSIRTRLASSAYTRNATERIWAFLSGEPLPAASVAASSAAVTTSAADASGQQQGPTARFLFTIFENQRWWVGLDWTAALVPNERPSWCASNQQPIAPPSVFTLPIPTTFFTSDGKGGRIKRTARWKWEEAEWKVLVRREVNGAPEVRRIEKQPQIVPEDLQSSSKLAKKLKDAVSSSSQDFGVMSPVEGREIHHPTETQEHLTDPEGWTYFDNKWESPNSKGGMGKYTRYRRWTRIAVLVETVEHVGPGELGIFKEKLNLQHIVSEPVVNTASVATMASESPTQDPGSPTTSTHRAESPTSLRQRLKNAVKGS